MPYFAMPTRYPKPTTRKPSLATMEKWVYDDETCKATDGCPVELDGFCPHGHVSWMIYLGLI